MLFKVTVNEIQNFVYVNHTSDSVEARSQREALKILKERYPCNGMHRYSFSFIEQ